jgi:hypothetical protein
MVRMMSRFPTTEIRYMDRNSPKKTGCRPGSPEKPMSWNSETRVKFIASILLRFLLEKKCY